MLEETVQKLIGLAKEEKWEVIDAEIPKVSRDPKVITWAYMRGLLESNEQVRDLAASILEKAEWFVNQTAIHIMVYNTMHQEKHPYAKFRMACALYAHGERMPEVIEVLKNAPEDVQPIAQKYLAQK